ncbi:hypothetical protein RND81_12G153200 [Saponaria officinalis]|uniref:Uncharacterized protein n=1 Tax=Saponaria officinalis TaxID=3572 RepID=A0AAW1HAW8_SAPOF
MMLVDQFHFNAIPHLPHSSSSSSSLRHVGYCCGSCGYELNLNSCNRNASVIGSKNYGKSIKRGIISFYSIDETRFTRIEQRRCKPYFDSARSWGLFRPQTKLLCKKCGNYVGNAYKFSDLRRCQFLPPEKSWEVDAISGTAETYDIRIRALQPSSYDESNIVT